MLDEWFDPKQERKDWQKYLAHPWGEFDVRWARDPKLWPFVWQTFMPYEHWEQAKTHSIQLLGIPDSKNPKARWTYHMMNIPHWRNKQCLVTSWFKTQEDMNWFALTWAA